MIYGITIVLNDCDFSKKNQDDRIKERYSFQMYFTNKNAALKVYKHQLNRVIHESGVSYGKADLRGCCHIYKATVTDGIIYNHGGIIKEHKI